MTHRINSNPDNPARKQLPRPRPKPSPAPPRAQPRSEAPLDLAALSAGAVEPVTSLSLATAHRTDAGRYHVREKAAAGAAPKHALDYGMNRNALDALSFVEATGWPGFQTLGLLAQLPEYRTMHETLADEVVRTWGKVVSTSKDEGAPEKINQLTQALERYKVRALVREAVIHDQAYGGAHIFPRIKDGNADALSDVPLLLTKGFVRKGSLDSFVAVEPMWVTPNAYNASDPTKPNFFKPQSWYMLSTVVDATRLFTIVSRPVSDLLKAAYSFRGVSISQLAMPYVDNWLRTRQSVSDTVKQFSITFLKTDMSQMLQPGGAYNLVNRAQLFNLTRDNRNLAICDMTQEEFAQINTPLSGLDALQAQSQEQMAAVSHIPLVKLTGITPAGLNANSDGEIRVWYDFVAGWQTANAGPLMTWILQLLQLSEFGDIDPGLSWEWNPLYELTDLELAEVREKNANTDRTLAETGAIDGKMIQDRLAGDPLSGYSAAIAERDPAELDEIAQRMLDEAMNPQDSNDGPDTDEPDPEATPAGGDRSGSNS
jgi:phage-related protein (TIGR01555 family)